jgi:hypothetical protein
MTFGSLHVKLNKEVPPMYCAHCGSQLKETARFCSACGRAVRPPADLGAPGSELPAPVPAAPPRPKVCPAFKQGLAAAILAGVALILARQYGLSFVQFSFRGILDPTMLGMLLWLACCIVACVLGFRASVTARRAAGQQKAAAARVLGLTGGIVSAVLLGILLLAIPILSLAL